MPDNFTSVTSSSWGGRILGSFFGMLIGIALAIGSVPLLVWNEGRTINTTRALEEASANFVAANPETVLSTNEGKLVYLTGSAQTPEVLFDPDYGIGANALRFERTAERYLWEEKKESRKEKNLGGSENTVTTYEYVKGWHKNHIDSSSFQHPEGHANPPAGREGERSFDAAKATIGAYLLPSELLSKLSADETLSLQESDLAKLPPVLRPQAHLSGSEIYIGADPASPQLGDTRVTFKLLRPTDVSLIAQQSGKSFVPYVAKSGKQVERIEKGQVSAAQMLEHAKSENQMIAWLVRAGGFLMLFIGFVSIARPFSVLGDFLPFVGSLIGAGAAIFAFAAALLTASVTIAVAWFAYRPLLSGGLIAGAVLVWYLLHRAHRQPARA